MKKMAIYSSLFCLLLLGQADAAQHSQHDTKKANESSRCSDPQQPASLQCAPAPSSQFDKQGRLWVVWSHAGHVYVTASDDQGKTFNPSIVVNRVPEAISARGENRPKIVVDHNGKIYVSWTTPLEKRFTGNVRFSYSSDKGRNFSEPVTVNDNLDITGHRFEALSVNKQGTVFMAWLDKRDRFKASQKGEQYIGAALYYTYSEDGGKTFKPNKNIMPHSCECCRVAIDIDDAQLPVIVWRNIYGTNTRDHSLVKFNKKDSPGKVHRISYDNWHVDACPHHGPAISIAKPDNNSDELYHLTWFNNAPERHGIFYSNMKAPKNKESAQMQTAIQIGDYSKGASHADVMSIGNNVWITWKEFDGIQESILLKESSDSGKHWSQERILTQTKNGSDYPFLVRDKDDVYLQWQTIDDGFKLQRINN